MKLVHSIIIFLLATVALVAELILYFVFGVGAGFAGGFKAITGTASIFVALMIFTAVAGFSAPTISIMGGVFKKPDLASRVYSVTLLVTAIICILFGTFVYKGANSSLDKNLTTSGSVLPSPTEIPQKVNATLINQNLLNLILTTGGIKIILS